MALAAPIAKGGTCPVMPDGFFCLVKPSETAAWEPRLTPDRSPFVFFYERFAV